MINIEVEAKSEAESTVTEVWKPNRKELLIMVSLSFISMMVALDATILVTVLPHIAQKLNGTSVEAFWTGTSYLLTSAIFQPVIASFSALFGRQQLLFVSIIFFTVGTILCSTAKDFATILTGRCIQGVGGGGMITLTQVIYCDMIPLRQRPKYFSMIIGAWSIGCISGPVIGGAFVGHASWRWCFHINYPFCALGFLVATLFVRFKAVEKLTLAQKLKRVDWIGCFLFIGSMTSFLVGLSWGGIQYPWKSAATLVPIILGFLGIVVFGGWQMYAKEHTLLPMSVFYNWSSIAAFYSAFVNGVILFTGLYYYPFYEMSVRGSSSTGAGVAFLPALCFMVPGSVVVSVLTTRLGRFRWAIWGGWAVTTVGCGLMILFDLHTKKVVLVVALAIIGYGAGTVLTSVNVGVQAISKIENSAMSASMYGFFRSLGMPLGVTLAGTLFQNSMSGRLLHFGLPTTIAHDSERYVFILRTMASSPEKSAILESYVKGFESVFIMMTAISASALIVSFAIRKFSMDKILLAQFTAR
ncbi:MFS general substrate transporter [Cucurbitaria berberidis CBS 394.84]|uniref:MFS general substrate transporter n=1 Tax=Cucurbitaria berberidis CBS 394.84 TaxID=1168544 RepID=A0A9P4L6P2_9PLEO|nr:MFS general substrate transporter [Cucurbitaria berberidis CBS 394.84]KAF1843499.1 MFS general substrate transporter [Cucurbitaria berberidis CBS 394.84]